MSTSSSEPRSPFDSLAMRAGRVLLLLVAASTSFGLYSLQKQPAVPVTPSAASATTSSNDSKEPTAADFVRRGDDLMQLQRESNVSRLYDLAEKEYRAALSLDPKHVEAILGLAWVSSSRHQFAKACDYAREALAIHPKLQGAYSLLADAAVELGDYEAAFQHCQTALDLGPNLTTYSRAAHLLWLTGDPHEAQVLMHKAIKAGGTRPEHTAWCRVELAQMHLHAGDLGQAEQQAILAFNAVPRHPRMLITMGRIKAAQQDFKAAEEFFTSALKSEPSHDALVALGELQLVQNKPEEAEKTFQRLIQMHTLDLSHPAQLARFYADHDRQLPDALAAAEAAHRESNSIYVLDTLAWCLHKNGRHEKARRIIEAALKWKTPDATIHYHAGMIYAQLGEKDAARHHLKQALQINPHFCPFAAPIARKELAREQIATAEDLQ
ncbi:MAG: tetratricopeptide repeat protein [Verrucomicrobiaceae bacterium]|nr:tetratricopeptide repeat protein [Verrucomicrobiaceae bacterium]